MNHKLVVGVVVIVKTRFVLAQNKIRLEADHIVEEATELVDLTLYNDVRARVLFKISLVLDNALLELVSLLRKLINLVPELKHSKEVL